MAFTNVLSTLVILLYALGSAGVFWGISASKARVRLMGAMSTWAGLALHTLLAMGVILLTPPEDLSRGHFLQLLAWSILLAYFAGWKVLKSGFISVTASPLALLLFILAFCKSDGAQVEMPGALKELFIILHIGPLYASLGLLALAFGAALLFLHMDRKLKSKAKFTEFDRELPALGVYDRLNHLAVIFGFPLYTLGIAAGFIWAPQVWSGSGGWDPKEIFSLFVWFLYAVTFYLRIVRGWRGRKAALLLIAIFSISLFSLLGVNLFMPTRHGFSAAAVI
ncbi:MAG: cytochrome c biogenesis protein CcsA [Deltaproteobacteria bacterium]|jgi:ABC-type transport system involved in cytochrome c biogenesis permease subunit|nr:cytochrome c biogenesis protein CcsA [Deltaproteobacteria bacterium]